MEVRPLADADRPWVAAQCRRWFGSKTVAALGRLLRPDALDGLVAWESGRRVGAVAYREESGEAEVALLVADPPGGGGGTALLSALEARARERRWTRLWAVTTNDNTSALRFYQRRGWDLVALHREAVAADRLLKPEIPACGAGGIPVRHLLELEWRPPPGEEAHP
jgi:GNAT superfamily N-acetyltransferase